MRAIGRILLACTIALVSPASRHSCRKTELSTWRAAWFRPNETLEIPRVKLIPGYRRALSPRASVVLIAAPRGSPLAPWRRRGGDAPQALGVSQAHPTARGPPCG